MNYQNYHKHSYYTNARISDSVVSYEDYAKKAVFLGQKVLSSVEHGWQGRYIECYEIAHKYDLKFVFGTETYYVHNRFEKDRTNAHLILLAKNENGRQAINDILSEANITGFYFQPRIDEELLFSLPKDDVWCTSACFTEDMVVTTNNGYKKIIDVSENDLVLTHKGTWEKIIKQTKRKYADDMFKLSIEGCYDDICCTKDHKFPVLEKYREGEYLKDFIVWKRADELLYTDRILNAMDENGFEDSRFFTVTNILEEYRGSLNYTRVKNKILNDTFVIDDLFLCVLGLFAAEGHIGKNLFSINFTFHRREENLYNIINRFSKRVCGIEACKLIKDNKMTVAIHSKELAIVFSNLFKKGAKNKSVPDFIKKLPPFKQMSFAKGAILGDGYRRKVKRGNRVECEVSFCSVSMDLAYGMRDIFENNGVKIYAYSTKARVDKNKVNHLKSYTLGIASTEFYNYWIEYEKNNDWYSFDWEDPSIINPIRIPFVIDGTKYIAKGVRKIETFQYDGLVYCLNIDNVHSFKVDGVNVHNCLGGIWKYGFEEAEKFIVKCKEHFDDNFFLEVQAHNTESQKEINKEILRLKYTYNIPLIAGVDSHYIDNDRAWERDDFIKSRGLHYEDEEGWYMDYPSCDELYNRFKEQGVLTDTEIQEALETTNVLLEVEEYDSPIFNKDIKMPTLYPDKTKEEKDKIFEDLVWRLWEEKKNNFDKDKWNDYIDEINREVQTIKDINHSDYFLIDYHIVKKAIEKGGEITYSGRGSAGGFMLNNILGFTTMDVVSSPVKLYPERFLSKTRILETKSMADIDLNFGTPEIAVEAQEEVMGEGHSCWMLTYGTYKAKAAWKMFAKAQNISYVIAEAVTKQIERYEHVLKETPGDETENVHVEDYIDDEYIEIFNKSRNYLGIVTSLSRHPCSSLLYQGDIRREIGLITIKSGKKETLCCLMDGKWAEKYKFLKNDILKVSVVAVIKELFRQSKIPEMTVDELEKACQEHPNVWDIYSKGITLGINQVEGTATTARVAKYKPKNISELCAFVAAIRPGFKSMYKRFENREEFHYNIPSIDNLIQTEQFPQSYILYQEQVMQILHYAGIPLDETYGVIKNIAKKRVAEVKKYKDLFIDNMINKLIVEEHYDNEKATQTAKDIWQIIDDNSNYSFNASHSLAVAYDSLYCAYFKALYPLVFYETYIKIMTAENKKDAVVEAQNEALSYFGIRITPYKFGEDNRQIRSIPSKNMIVNSLQSVKGFSKATTEALWQIRGKYKHFVDLLIKIRNNADIKINSKHIDILISIDYFDMFGNQNELREILRICEMFNHGTAKTISKDKLDEEQWLEPLIKEYATDKGINDNTLKRYTLTGDCVSFLCDCEDVIKAEHMPDVDDSVKIVKKMEYLGYLLPTNKEVDRPKLYITKMFPINRRADGKHCGDNLIAISIGSGKQTRYTIWDSTTKKNGSLKVGDIILCKDYKRKAQTFEITDYDIIESKEVTK